MSKNWKQVRLGDAATFINGYAFKPSDWGNEGLPIIRIQNLTGSSDDINYFDGEYHQKHVINKGDILISWSASLGVYEWKKGKALLNQHIFKVQFNKLDFEKKYFKYLIKMKIEDMLKHVHGATMKHITKKDFDRILINYPPFETQRHIAATLDKANKLITLRKKQLEELDALAESVFYDMFGDPVKNERSWKTNKLEKIGVLARGKSKHRPRNAPELLGGSYPLIQTGDIASAGLFLSDYNQTYSELGLSQSKMWNKGTLCITIAANIAKTSILKISACFPDSVVGFTPSNQTNAIFIHFWFSFFQELLEKQAPEVAQKNINLKILSELDVIVPPLELQTRFATIIEKIEEQKALVRKALKESEDLFQRLMQDLFHPN